MTDTTKTEALKLADLLEAAADNADMGRPKDKRSAHRRAAAELRRLSAVEAERDHYKARCEALTDDALSRVMDASEDELNAALKLEGKDPDDTARLAGQAIELALLTAERDRLAAECEELRKDVEHKDLCAEQLGRELMKAHAECEALRAMAGQARDALSSATGYISEQTSAGCEIARALAAIDAAMGGKESQGGNGSGQEGRA